MAGPQADHLLKCWPEPFQAVRRGDKRHEIRLNDRDYQVGEIILLREYVPGAYELANDVKGRGVGYTGEAELVRISYMSRGPDWGLPETLVVLSIQKVETVRVDIRARYEGP